MTPKRRTPFDPAKRLLGTWKSDRRRTFRHFKPNARATAAKVQRLKAVFGKLVMRWERGAVHSDYDGACNSHQYEVVATDEWSVIVRIIGAAENDDVLKQIHFEGEYYWIALSGHLCEWFKRVK